MKISNENLIYKDKEWFIETLAVDVDTGKVIDSSVRKVSEKIAHKIIDDHIDEYYDIP